MLNDESHVEKCPGAPRCLHCPCCEGQVRVAGVCLDCLIQARRLKWTVEQLMAAAASENDTKDEIGRRWKQIQRQSEMTA